MPTRAGRRLCGVPGQLRSRRQPGRRRIADRRLHPHRRRVHRRRGRRAHLRLSEPHLGHRPDLPRHPRRHHPSQPPGPGRDRPSLSPADHDLHRRAAGHHRHRPDPPPGPPRPPARASRSLPTHGLQTVSVLLVLKAFSAGCSALTGVEAIANGVPLFKEPRAVRAKRTELLLGVILGVMLLGLAVLARPLAHRPPIGPDRAQPDHGRSRSVGTGPTTSCRSRSPSCWRWPPTPPSVACPILASLLARDHYLPHLFALRGDRQVFANGIWVLAGPVRRPAHRGRREHQRR